MVDAEESEEGFCSEIGKLVIEGCFRMVDNVEPPFVILLVPLCCDGMDEFVPWCVDGDLHDVRGESVFVELSEHLLKFLDVERRRFQVNDLLAIPEVDGEQDAVP